MKISIITPNLSGNCLGKSLFDNSPEVDFVSKNPQAVISSIFCEYRCVCS